MQIKRGRGGFGPVAQLVSEMSGYVKSVQLMDFAVAMSDQKGFGGKTDETFFRCVWK